MMELFGSNDMAHSKLQRLLSLPLYLVLDLIGIQMLMGVSRRVDLGRGEAKIVYVFRLFSAATCIGAIAGWGPLRTGRKAKATTERYRFPPHARSYSVSIPPSFPPSNRTV